MGASRVEAVSSAKHALHSPDLSRYTYVVVKEEAVPPCLPGVGGKEAVYVDVNWIKECLIAGRLLPIPEWE